MRVLVQVQTSTAPMSSGPRPAFSSAARAACSEISSSDDDVYRRSRMPVLSKISCAAIGDQL